MPKNIQNIGMLNDILLGHSLYVQQNVPLKINIDSKFKTQ